MASDGAQQQQQQQQQRPAQPPPISSISRAHLYIGRDFQFAFDLQQSLDDAVEDSFDFIVTPLVHPRFRRDSHGVSDGRLLQFTRSDRLFKASKWASFVVGKVSSWFDFEAGDARVRRDSEAALMQVCVLSLIHI